MDSIDGPISNLVSISEWSVQGTCMCNGHASICSSPIEGEDIYPGKVSTSCVGIFSTFIYRIVCGI